jgi:hypothetical protein
MHHGRERQAVKGEQKERAYIGNSYSGQQPLPMGLTWREYLILHTDCECAVAIDILILNQKCCWLAHSCAAIVACCGYNFVYLPRCWSSLHAWS